jgi:RNA polymerase sigma-70 factor, ECF subfamily
MNQNAAHIDPPAGQAQVPPTPATVFEEYATQVYHLVRRMLGNAADAEDVTQEVFLLVIHKLPTFRREAALSTWLHRVAVNTAVNYRRKRALRRLALPEWLMDLRGRQSGPDQLTLAREGHQLVEEAIAGLPKCYRNVCLLADVEEWPNVDIAEMLGLSVQAVKSRLHRAHLLLRRALAPYFGEETAWLRKDGAVRYYRRKGSQDTGTHGSLLMALPRTGNTGGPSPDAP